MGKIDRQMNGLRDGKTNPLVVAKREEIQLNIQIEILNSKENLWNELYASKARWRNPRGDGSCRTSKGGQRQGLITTCRVERGKVEEEE